MKSRMTMMTVMTALATTTGGCELLGVGGRSPLPPLEAFVVPKPSDARSGTAQAACADGNDAVLDLEVRVDELNAGVAADVALLRGLYDATPTGQGGVVIYDVQQDGRTLNVQVVDGGDELAISGTITGPDGTKSISGAYDRDGAEGAVAIAGLGDELTSVWSTEDGGVEIVRTEGARVAAVDVDGARVQLAITAGAEVIAAHWDRETGEGELVVADGPAACWSGGDSADDMCDVTCASP